MIYKIKRKKKLLFQQLKFDVFLILRPVLKEMSAPEKKSERFLLRFSLTIQNSLRNFSFSFHNMFGFYNSTSQSLFLNKFRNVFHIKSDGFVVLIVRFANCDNHDRHIPFRVESEFFRDYILLEAADHICVVAVRPCDKL